ncbi:hypothetical protein [Mesorhizobium sp.]|uniref:hypothetical protein n=1 Tax=Mesorhizobium sp. TaxID=1871066 RepID=UPI000FE7C5C4|nr:hypothetical protein [Mesorhizobium sp.]RWQ61953.1 MAG: hypothetical protein EOS86_32520 [Mesorhizobium sp.]
MRADTLIRATFAAGAETIAARQTRLTWLAPGRDENAAGSVLQRSEAWISSAQQTRENRCLGPVRS